MDAAAALQELGGYATRRGLLRHGTTRRSLARALDEGRVVRLRRGVYGLGMPEGVEVLAAAVVALGAVVSHDSAAVLWDLEMVHQPGQRVTVPRDHSRARHPGVQVARREVEEVVVRHGLPVTGPVQTVLDCARVLPLDEAVVIADSALRRGLVTLRELRTAAAKVRGRDGPRVRRVVALADPRCGSVLESLLRVLLVQNGLTPDHTQLEIRDERGRFVARVDFAWLRARLIVEADGFEFHSARGDYRKDRRRGNAFCRLDWSLLRFTWEDVRLHPEYVLEAVRFELAKPPRRARRPRVPARTHEAA